MPTLTAGGACRRQACRVGQRRRAHQDLGVLSGVRLRSARGGPMKYASQGLRKQVMTEDQRQRQDAQAQLLIDALRLDPSSAVPAPARQATPIDIATGLQSGAPGHGAPVYVVAGYLVTHANGSETLFRNRHRAELYAARNQATLEPVFVRRASIMAT